jgi:hypothetical protein
MVTSGMMRWLLSALLGFTLLAVRTPGQQSTATEIKIDSFENGLGSSSHREVVIQARDGKSYLGRDVIDSGLIEALLAALRSPILATPQAGNLGITPEWLRDNADVTAKGGAPNQQALFREAFSDPTTIDQLLPSRFKFLKFDNYPTLRVTVKFAKGDQWTAVSKSYYPFMLPWAVNANGQTQTTYNADIPRAIAALMPKGALNRERLNDDELKTELVDAVMTHIKGQWDLLGVENRAPGSFDILKSRFQFERAAITPYRSVDYGYVGNGPGPHEEHLEATLRKPSLPPNVADDVVLLFHDGSIDGVGDLAERLAPYEALALSVPWLNAYRAQHPEMLLHVRYVDDRSFSTKAMQSFAADMKELGKQSLADEVAANQDKAALVFLDYGSFWIILPDKRMILWRHYLPSFLKWPPDAFKIRRCVDYNQNGGGCVGSIVSPAGDIQP